MTLTHTHSLLPPRRRPQEYGTASGPLEQDDTGQRTETAPGWRTQTEAATDVDQTQQTTQQHSGVETGVDDQPRDEPEPRSDRQQRVVSHRQTTDEVHRSVSQFHQYQSSTLRSVGTPTTDWSCGAIRHHRTGFETFCRQVLWTLDDETPPVDTLSSIRKRHCPLVSALFSVRSIPTRATRPEHWKNGVGGL